ncbi:hypothetical protein BRC97_01300 [Halobacteriales archaeon QS_6_71_20]|nr:MAG: hypothetical protein BRC97_01300 [Halobacteriales archaeon QS_6_71_20]
MAVGPSFAGSTVCDPPGSTERTRTDFRNVLVAPSSSVTRTVNSNVSPAGRSTVRVIARPERPFDHS